MTIEDWFVFNFDTTPLVGSIFWAVLVVGLFWVCSYGIDKYRDTDNRWKIAIIAVNVGFIAFNVIFGLLQYMGLFSFFGTEWDDYLSILALILSAAFFVSVLFDIPNDDKANSFLLLEEITFTIGIFLAIIIGYSGNGLWAIIITPSVFVGLLVAYIAASLIKQDLKKDDPALQKALILGLCALFFVGFSWISNEGREPISSILSGGLAIVPIVLSIAVAKSKKKRINLKNYCFSGNIGESQCKPFKVEYCKNNPKDKICKL